MPGGSWAGGGGWKCRLITGAGDMGRGQTGAVCKNGAAQGPHRGGGGGGGGGAQNTHPAACNHSFPVIFTPQRHSDTVEWNSDVGTTVETTQVD